MSKPKWLALLAAFLLISALAAPCPAAAQQDAAPFGWVSALGYGAAVAGAGFLTLGDGWYAFDLRVLGGGLAGMALGGWVGSLASRRVEREEPVGRLHRNLVRLGTVLAGGTVGAIGAGVIIAGDGRTGTGNDEALFAALVAVGMLGGAYLQYRVDSQLTAGLNVGLRTDGGLRLGLRLRFGDGVGISP